MKIKVLVLRMVNQCWSSEFPIYVQAITIYTVIHCYSVLKLSIYFVHAPSAEGLNIVHRRIFLVFRPIIRYAVFCRFFGGGGVLLLHTDMQFKEILLCNSAIKRNVPEGGTT